MIRFLDSRAGVRSVALTLLVATMAIGIAAAANRDLRGNRAVGREDEAPVTAGNFTVARI